MALLLKTLTHAYIHAINDLSDPRTNKWFLIQSPIPTIFILSCYLLFVFDLGPKLMKNRRPMQIDKIIMFYNMLQVVVCSYLFISMAPHVFKSNYMCQEVDYSNEAMPLAWLGYLYFLTKILDLLDTVFFILRKKQRQVTFLHVYHHFIMVGYMWGGIKYLCGGQGIFLACINSFVHSVMYFYYLLTSYDSSLKRSVWWKKHITQLQLFQFLAISIWMTLPLFSPGCKYPRGVTFAALPQLFAITGLFMDFYYKTYIRQKPIMVDNNNNCDVKTMTK